MVSEYSFQRLPIELAKHEQVMSLHIVHIAELCFDSCVVTVGHLLVQFTVLRPVHYQKRHQCKNDTFVYALPLRQSRLVIVYVEVDVPVNLLLAKDHAETLQIVFKLEVLVAWLVTPIASVEHVVRLLKFLYQSCLSFSAFSANVKVFYFLDLGLSHVLCYSSLI